MKNKHVKKLIELLLDGEAFNKILLNPYTGDNVKLSLTDEMREVLEKLRGKEKPSKLQNAVQTLIEEYKKTGKPINIQIPPPPPDRIAKDGEEPTPPPKNYGSSSYFTTRSGNEITGADTILPICPVKQKKVIYTTKDGKEIYQELQEGSPFVPGYKPIIKKKHT